MNAIAANAAGPKTEPLRGIPATEDYQGDFCMSELAVTAQIMRHWFGPHPAGACPLWNSYPDDYIVFDTETTGIDPTLDLIVEYGWHITRGRQSRDNDSVLINWIGHYGITEEWLAARMEAVRAKMAERGLNYRFTVDMLKERGIPAPEAVENIFGFFNDALERGELLVGHNIITYDRKMLDALFARFHGGRSIQWPHNCMVDTGLVEKASRQNRVPWANDTIFEWARRVASPPFNVKWSLDGICIPKYRLAERYQLQQGLNHTAAFDCLATHCLFDTYRDIGEGKFLG